MIGDIEYAVIHTRSRTLYPVTGMQVGRFAIRMKLERVKFADGTTPRLFQVDHPATHACFGDFDRFEDALAYADDLSRYSENDPDSSDMEEVKRLIGRRTMAWARDAGDGTFIPYREWLAKRAA